MPAFVETIACQFNELYELSPAMEVTIGSLSPQKRISRHDILQFLYTNSDIRMLLVLVLKIILNVQLPSVDH